MSTSGISSIAMGGSVGVSAGGAAAHVVATGADSKGRMEHLVHTLQGFSNSEVMAALMQSIHHLHHHHHAAGETGASAAVGLSLGPQATGRHAGYSAASANSGCVGAQVSVHA